MYRKYRFLVYYSSAVSICSTATASARSRRRKWSTVIAMGAVGNRPRSRAVEFRTVSSMCVDGCKGIHDNVMMTASCCSQS